MKLIVFDIDDTLTKSECQHQLAYVNTMKEFGITKINQAWSEYEHHTDSYILKVNFEANLKKDFDFGFVEKFESRMTQILLTLKQVSEIAGARDCITSFSKRSDYAIAFATGSLLQLALIKLNQAEIYFNEQLVVGSNSVFSREEIVQGAINQAKLFHQVEHFEQIISVGDGIWDLNTARNLGLHFIGIGNKNLHDFKQARIQYHIEDWKEFSLETMEQKFGIKR